MKRLALVLCLASVGGCFGPPNERIVEDDGSCPDFLPAPNHPCLEGQCGNELGVGQPCTKGGDECSVFNFFGGEAGICIPDFDDNTQVHACSKPCSVDDDCGSGALCFPDPRTDRLGCVIEGCEGF